MTNTLNARNTPAMPEVWIPSAGIDAFVMHCATLAGAKAATFGLRWAYVKFLAALITFLCEIRGASERMISQIRSACFWRCIALIAFANTAHDAIQCAGLCFGKANLLAKLAKVFPVYFFAIWRDKRKFLRVDRKSTRLNSSH